MAETAIKVAPYIKKYVIDPQVEQAEKDAEVIKQQVIQPKVETILDAGLREAGLTGGFSDWMHWGDTGGRWGGVVGGQPEYKSGHVMVKVYPGEYVLTERQAADAKKAGAKLPEWGFQRDELPKHISRNVKADRGGRNYSRVHGRPPPLATPATWLDYSRRYNQME